MKNIILFFGLMSLVCSCAKQTEVAKNIAQIDKALVTEVTRISNPSVRLLAYEQLNFNEKFIIWQEHLNGWKNNDKLNIEQQSIIDDVLSYIKPEMWINNISKFAVANSENTAILQYKVKKNFSKVLAGLIFGSIENNFTVYPPIESIIYDDGHYRCQCNVGSWVNQCSSQYPSCGSASVCNQYGTYECGFLSWFQCNGDCFYTPS